MNDDNMGFAGNGGGWIWAFLIIALIFGGNGFGYGGNNAAYATMADVNAAINNQTQNQAIQNVGLAVENSNYETARLIDNQTMAMMNQNNTNMLTAINGFNTTQQAIAAGFNSVNSNIADLGYKMDQCCCSIKTMLLENRLADTQIALQNATNVAVNAGQSQYLLGQMGHWVANSNGAATVAG